MCSLYWESSLCNIVSNMIFSVEASLNWQEKHVTHLPHVPIHTFLIWRNIFPCNFFLVVNKFPPLYYLYSLHGIDKLENRITKGCLVLPLVQSPIKKKKKVGINISAFVLLSHVGFHPWWAHIRAPPKHRSFRVQTLPFHYIVLTCDGNQR